MVFHRFDRTRSGQVNASDILAFLDQNNLEDEGVSKVTLSECQLFISTYDLDEDGVLEFPEFRRMLVGDDEFICKKPLVALDKRNPCFIEDSTKLTYEVEYAVVRIII